jgi:hypothetical protein
VRAGSNGAADRCHAMSESGVDGKAVFRNLYAQAHGGGANADADGDLPERSACAAAGESRVNDGGHQVDVVALEIAEAPGTANGPNSVS